MCTWLVLYFVVVVPLGWATSLLIWLKAEVLDRHEVVWCLVHARDLKYDIDVYEGCGLLVTCFRRLISGRALLY